MIDRDGNEVMIVGSGGGVGRASEADSARFQSGG